MNRVSWTPVIVMLLFASAAAGCDARELTPKESELRALAQKLKPLHKPIAKPQAGDWLAEHYEPGQTFAQYVRSEPVTPNGRRRVIYIQPLGPFTKTQRRIVELSADFLGRYFDRSVKIQDDLPLSVIPDAARRQHPSWGMDQILTTYVLDDVLKPRLPDDAAAYIAFTATDLWPGKGWNFVFGQASLSDRVGVWSIYRNGQPDKSDEDFRLCLLRTLKTATHETGHMFSIQHCTAFECNMCGSNNREESDRKPLWLCPECVAKVWWATGADPQKRYERLLEFCREHGLTEQAEFYSKALELIE